MRRPWKVAVAVVLGAALMPASALAAPQITITNPENGKTYTKGNPVAVSFTCTDATVSCTATDGKGAPLANGAALDTSTLGPSYITVVAKDATTTNHAAGDVQRRRGRQRRRRRRRAAHAGDDARLAHHLRPVHPGRRPELHGDPGGAAALDGRRRDALRERRQLRPDRPPGQRRVLPAGRRFRSRAPSRPHRLPDRPPLVFAPVGGSAAPTTVLTYDGPINETDTLTFKQPIGAGDSLRTGPYSKTLTFTLSTTQP